MLFIISPAKQMKTTGLQKAQGVPMLYEHTKEILNVLQTTSKEKLMLSMKIKEQVAIQNMERYQAVRFDELGTCALDTYDGLQFKSMNIEEFNEDSWLFSQQCLRIISGLYGIVKPLDSIYPYRLEMQTKLEVCGQKDIYSYWSDILATTLLMEIENHEDPYVLNLASKEYEKAIKPYIPKEQWIDVIFYIEKNGKLKSESTQVKMARGLMVNYLVSNRIEKLEAVKEFKEAGYCFNPALSTATSLVFVKK